MGDELKEKLALLESELAVLKKLLQLSQEEDWSTVDLTAHSHLTPVNGVAQDMATSNTPVPMRRTA